MNKVSPKEINRHRAKIMKWFDAVIHDGGIDRYDHLHVDYIDKAWKSRRTWISAALESFELALKIRDDSAREQPLIIVLTFDLKGDVRPLGITFHDRRELQKNLWYIPPSLYVFRRGGGFWNQMEEYKKNATDYDVIIKKLNAPALFGETRGIVECIYTETMRPDDEEYSRHVHLAG